MAYNAIEIKQWDSRCQCYVEPDYKPEIKTDTARAYFPIKKKALKFIHDAMPSVTGYRLDSIKIK